MEKVSGRGNSVCKGERYERDERSSEYLEYRGGGM